MIPPAANVPVFKLYGETTPWPTPDLLHCESISERSRLHDWHIQPHRHADLVHLLHLSSGQVMLELEGSVRERTAPLVIVVPAMGIHGFRFSTDTQGHIITLARPLTERLTHDLADQTGVLNKAKAIGLDDACEATRVATLVGQIDAEYRQPAPGRERLLTALIEALAVEVARLGDHDCRPAKSPLAQGRHRALSRLQDYQTLIETQFRQQPSVEHFAKQLGLSSAHLNLLCRQLVDRSALQLLHERLLLEAKRQLTYTNMTIGEVADSLGFSEPAYFTRFFKRLSGLSPRDFRRRQIDTAFQT